MANQKQQPAEKIELTCSGPHNQADGKYRILVSAKVSKGSAPLVGINVVFYINLAPVNIVPVTDNHGIASSDIPDLIDRPTIVRALLEGTSIGSTLVLKSSAPTRLIPDKIGVQAYGSKGNYILSCSVVDKDRAPVPGEEIHIYDEDKCNELGVGTTDEHGRASIKIKRITKPWANVSVEVAGVKPDPLFLRGPRRKTNTRNNTISMCMCAGVLVWLAFNVFLIGVGPQANVAERLTSGPAKVERAESPYGQYRASLHAFQRSQAPKSSEEVMADSVRAYSWGLWAVYLLVTIAYTVYAYSEEVFVYLADAIHGIRNKRGSFKDLPDVTPTAGQESTTPTSQHMTGLLKKYGGEALRFGIVDFFLEKLYRSLHRRMVGT